MIYNTRDTTRNYSPIEEFAVTGMSMKCKKALLTNCQVAHISSRHIIFMCVMRRTDKLKTKVHVEFSVIYS